MPTVNAIREFSAISTPISKHVQKWNNEVALNQLGKELEGSMERPQIDYYLEFIKNMCKKLKIQVQDLPINSEHRGNLSTEQNKQVYDAVMNKCLFDMKA